VLSGNRLLTLPIGLGGLFGLAQAFWEWTPQSPGEWFVALFLLAFCLMMLCLTIERDKCPRP
jgi:hypothetical protein